jgi:20S proteasome subunit alpha 6
LLVAGCDPQTGPHLFQTEPSGVYFEFKAQAIGARSQSARTYLEKNYSSFADASLDDLVRHVLHALKGASQKKLTSRNVSVGFVGADAEFRILEGDAIRAYVNAVTQEDDEDESEEAEKEKERGRKPEATEQKDEVEAKQQDADEAKAEQDAQRAMQE